MAVAAADDQRADPGRRGGGAGAGKDPTLRLRARCPTTRPRVGTFTVLATARSVHPRPDPGLLHRLDRDHEPGARALTQYVYDPESNDMELVPDMATDLGRPNEDNTEWTFTLRDGLKYEDGTAVKAEDVAYAITRSFAIEELPDGPTYQLQFFLDGDKYKGPYKDKAPYKGVEVNGNDITIKMSRPFPEMDYYASFPVFTAIPQAKDTKEELRQPAAGHRSLHVRGLQAGPVADAGQEPQLGPRHRPGPHPGRRRVGVQVRRGHRQARERILSDTGDARPR